MCFFLYDTFLSPRKCQSPDCLPNASDRERSANRAVDLVVTQHLSLNYSAIHTWYTCQVVVAHLAMSGVEIVMMLRGRLLLPRGAVTLTYTPIVYALYDQNRWIGLGFFCLLMAGVIALVVGIVVTLPHDFQISDTIDHTPESFAYFGFVSFYSSFDCS